MGKRLEVLGSIHAVNDNFWNTRYVTERWAGAQRDGDGAILQPTGSAGTDRDPGGEDTTGQVKGHHQLHTGKRGSSNSICLSLLILFHWWNVHFHSCMPYLVLIWSHSQSLYKCTHTLISPNELCIFLNLNWRPIDENPWHICNYVCIHKSCTRDDADYWPSAEATDHFRIKLSTLLLFSHQVVQYIREFQ